MSHATGTERTGFLGALSHLRDRRMLVLVFLGFSSGIPLGLTGGTLQAWMTESGASLPLIGLAALVGTPYTLKYLWSPALDRWSLPLLGRRRGWMLLSQIGLLVAIFALAFWRSPGPGVDLAFPAHLQALQEAEGRAGAIQKGLVFGPLKFIASIPLLVRFFVLPLLVAVLSASQDIVVDAYRTEMLEEEERGLGAGIFVMGYRLAMLVSGALALILADHLPWRAVYLLMATTLLIGILGTLLAPERPGATRPPVNLREAVVQPFVEYFRRRGAFEVLAFVLLFKLGDVLCESMKTPFLLKTGFTKTDIGAVNKGLGLVATIVGGVFGGAWMARLGTLRSLWIFGTLQAGTNLAFALLAVLGKHYPAMVLAIGFDNLAGGMGTAAYTAFLMSLCNRRFTATQYALLTSLMATARVFLGSLSGFLAARVGWVEFFLLTALAAAPGLVLLLRYRAWTRGPEPA